MTTLTHPLQGIYAASITPFDDDGFPALHVLSQHLRRMESDGCHGVLILGTTGEGPSLSVEERISIFRAAAAERGTLRLLAGTGAASLTDAITLTTTAFDLGYEGVVTVPPFYYKGATVEGLFAFYHELIRKAVPEDGYLLLYHIPQVSGIAVEPDLIRRLRDAFPDQAAGIKDSSGSLDNTLMLCREFEGFQVFSGTDGLLSETLTAGGAGSITAPANVFSGLARQVFDAFHDDRPTDSIQAQLTDSRKKLTDLGRPLAASLKALLHLQGLLPNDYVRPPLNRLSPEDEAKLKESFEL